MNKQQMVSWVKEHKKELIIGGVAIGVTIASAIVLKKVVKLPVKATLAVNKMRF